MKYFFNVIILLLFGSLAKSQELVSIKYTGDRGVDYDCLLVSYDPDDAYMRIYFNENGKEYLVNIKYNTLPAQVNSKGQEYVLMIDDSAFNHANGIASAFLSEEYYDDFAPPCFIWFTNSTISPNDDRPYFTEDQAEFTNQKKVTSCQLINPEDITTELLLEFFYDDEPEFEELKQLCRVDENVYRALPPLKIKPVLHFVMVVNKDDKKIGVSCSKDQEKLNKELSAVARTLGIFYKPYFIYCANDLTKAKLESKLKSVNPGTEDIVFFSYSGHGSRWADQKDDYPFMNLWVTPPYNEDPKDQADYQQVKEQINRNSLGISQAYDILTKKNARLNIVLGDMCNSSIGVPRPVNPESYFTFGHRDGSNFLIRDTLKLRKLFINARGNLLSSAAKPDELASGNSTAGGYYTTGFIDALREAASFRPTKPSWENIIKKTIDNALVYRQKADPNEVQSGLRYNKIIENPKN